MIFRETQTVDGRGDLSLIESLLQISAQLVETTERITLTTSGSVLTVSKEHDEHFLSIVHGVYLLGNMVEANVKCRRVTNFLILDFS